MTISSLSLLAASTPPALVSKSAIASAGPKNLFTISLLLPQPRVPDPPGAPLILIDTPRGDEFPVSRAAPIPLANSESTQCSHDCRSAGTARMPYPWALAAARRAMLVGERVGPPCPDADSQKQRISVW